MSEERFIDLESRLAHQDNLLNDLNDVVTDQQQKIMQLEDFCKALLTRLQAADSGLASGDAADEKPPHY